MFSSTLVLSGGGVAGIAWELGLLQGLRDASPATCDALLHVTTNLIGTSAGSVVASQLAGGTDLTELFGAQIEESNTEIAAELDLEAFASMIAVASAGTTSPEEGRRALGRIALTASTVEPALRRAAVEARLPVTKWPLWPLRVTAVDTETGELRVFDRTSGVNLVDAVTASCAVPVVWPVVPIDGHLYMDGGTRTIANADLAAGSDRVLILVPLAEPGTGEPALITDAELAALAAAAVLVVYADAASVHAIGPNPLDPTVRAAAAQAGRTQGASIAEQLAEFWS